MGAGHELIFQLGGVFFPLPPFASIFRNHQILSLLLINQMFLPIRALPALQTP